MAGALSGFVPRLEVRTAVTPAFSVSTAGSEKPSPLAKWMRPAVTAFDSNGYELLTVAPYGDATPGERAGKMLLFGGIVLGIVAGIFLAGRASA